MEIRTFWITIVKILGLILFFDFLEIFTQLFTALSYIFLPNITVDLVFPTLFSSILIIVIYLAVISTFLFKSSWLIDTLKLEKHSKVEKLNIELKPSAIITIAIIIVGGLIFINGFSSLCKSLFDYFTQKNLQNHNPTISWIIFNSVKTLIGYLLMTNSKVFVNYIVNQTKTE